MPLGAIEFDREFIAYFKLAHGFFNACMAVLFCVQGWWGLVIRRARLGPAPFPQAAVRRHRHFGPVFLLWGVLGYLAGIIVVLLDKGRLTAYPLHLATGTVLMAVLAAAYRVSREITAKDIPARVLHARLGVCLLALYAIQILLGLGILL
jgi:hypothetical protein